MILYYKCKRKASNNALTNLNTFSTLHDIFKYCSSEGSISEENPILKNATVNNEKAKQYLSNIENILNNLNVNQWSIKERNLLRKRLTSGKTSEFFSLLSELDTYSSLVRYVGLENVTYQYSAENGKRPDFKIDVNSKEIILELISLHERQPILRMKNIFNHLCESLFSALKDDRNYYIRISIDVGRLPTKEEADNKGKVRSVIDIENSIKKLEDGLEDLHLEKLIGFNCSLDFDKQSYSNLRISDFITIYDRDNGLDSDAHSQQRYLQWYESVNINRLVFCPFDSIIIANAHENECIEVSSVDFFSELGTSTLVGEEASKKQMSAFKDHLKRSIKEKIRTAQTEKGKPCIILIKSRLDIDWQYEYENDIDDYLQLQNGIKEELKKSTKISGAIIYYSELREGKYIENRNADPEIKIKLAELQDMNILRPYNPILIDEENKIETQDDFNKQREKILRCLDIEQDITEWRDKQQLLENIRIFLDNYDIDENTLSSLERIILKYCQDNSHGSDYRRILEKEPKDPIFFEGIDFKAMAVTCLLVLLDCKYSKTNIEFLAKLCEEDNLSVRLIISNKLHLIYEANKCLAVKIINKYFHENWFSRYCLIPIMNFFYNKNAEISLQLQFLNTTIKYYVDDKKHCTETMSFATDLLLYNALLHNEFKELVFSLLKNTPEGDILVHIAHSCGFGNKVKNERLQKLITNINTDILNYSSSLEVKQIASYRFLTNLIRQNVSLYPAIKDYLDKVSKLSVTIDKLYLSFSIFDYLDHFCMDFAVDSCLYLQNVINSNKIEDLTHSSHHMFNLVERLLGVDLPINLREGLFKIIKTYSVNGEPYCKYQADLLKQKYSIR